MADNSRDTRQRQALRRVLQEAGRPLGPKELLGIAKTEVPGLGIATIYRNLKTMLESGQIEKVDLPGQAPRYRVPNDGQAHLFIDQQSNAVYPVEVDLSGLQVKLGDGFQIQRMQLICYGQKLNGQKNSVRARRPA